MKNMIKKITAIIFPVIFTALNTIAQGPPLPDPNAGPGGVNQINCQSSAPVGEGYWILLSLAACYAFYVVWKSYKTKPA